MFLRKIDLERGNSVICVGLFGHCGDEEVIEVIKPVVDDEATDISYTCLLYTSRCV